MLYNKESIRKMASSNTTKISGMKDAMLWELRRIDKDAITITPDEWCFDSKTKRFYKHIYVRFSGEKFVYMPIVYEQDGVTITARYDHWDDRMAVLLEIDEWATHVDAQNITKALRELAAKLRHEWAEMIAKVGIDYFNIHKDRILKYPSINRSINSKVFCVWECRGDVNKTMQTLTKNTITNLTFANLSTASYFPALWTDDTETETQFNVGHGIILHVSRAHAVHKDIMEYPKVSIWFELIGSDDPAFKAAFDACFWHTTADKKQHFMDFLESFNDRPEWVMEANGTVSCIIPIIWQDDADYILSMAKKTLGREFKVTMEIRDIPLFDNDSHKCIKVSFR